MSPDQRGVPGNDDENDDGRDVGQRRHQLGRERQARPLGEQAAPSSLRRTGRRRRGTVRDARLEHDQCHGDPAPPGNQAFRPTARCRRVTHRRRRCVHRAAEQGGEVADSHDRVADRVRGLRGYSPIALRTRPHGCGRGTPRSRRTGPRTARPAGAAGQGAAPSSGNLRCQHRGGGGLDDSALSDIGLSIYELMPAPKIARARPAATVGRKLIARTAKRTEEQHTHRRPG